MRNIVVICLDSVRKDFYDEHAQNLRSLSDISIDQCRAASSWSVPSHASMLTGLLPHQHGLHTHNFDFSKLPEKYVFTNLMEEYTTISISANPFTSARFSFDKWFDICVNISHTRRRPNGVDARASNGIVDHLSRSFANDATLDSLVNGTLYKVEEKLNDLQTYRYMDDGTNSLITEALETVPGKEPYLLFMNFMEAHHPHFPTRGYDSSKYNLPRNWDSRQFDFWKVNQQGPESMERHQTNINRFREFYAASIDYMDRKISDFLADLSKQSKGDVTTIITADHGENLGYESDDYLFEHTGSLSEGLLHIPLDFVNPPSGFSPDDGIISHLQFPEIISAFTNDASPDVVRNRASSELIGCSLDDEKANQEYWDRAIRALYDYDSGVKYVWDSLGKSKSYRIDFSKASVQTEHQNQLKRPEWKDNFFDENIKSCKKEAKNNHNPDVLDPGITDQLEDLGYL